MKVLILSCNTGQGHNSAGNAVLAEFKKRGIECEMLDTLKFDSDFTSKLVSNIHAKSAIHIPRLYGIGVIVARFLDRVSRRRSICYVANTAYATKMHKYITKNGYDTLILPHVFPAESITCIRRKFQTDFKAYFIATDYTYPPFLRDSYLDGYFIPHKDLFLNFAKESLPADCIVPVGIPVSETFAQKTDRLSARKQLGLPVDGNILLVMTGSMGYGDTEPLVKELLHRMPDDATLVVMGGRNEKMKKRLRHRYGKDGRLRVIDFTREVSLYMDAADLLFTKPGGLSSTEAAVKGIPTIHTKPIPGWEEENIEFFRKHGLSLSGHTSEDLVTHALWLLGNPWAREAMVKAQEDTVNKFAARDICDYVLRMQSDTPVESDNKKE